MAFAPLACPGPHSAELCANFACRHSGCQGRMPETSLQYRDRQIALDALLGAAEVPQVYLAHDTARSVPCHWRPR